MFFRLEPPSGVIQSVTELIPETYETNRETQNVNKDSKPENSNQRNAPEDGRENQKVCIRILITTRVEINISYHKQITSKSLKLISFSAAQNEM